MEIYDQNLKALCTVCYGCTQSNRETAVEFLLFAQVLPVIHHPAIFLSASLSSHTHMRVDTCWHVQMDSVLYFYIHTDIQSIYCPAQMCVFRFFRPVHVLQIFRFVQL